MNSDRKAALLVPAIGGLLAGLCCLTPIVMVLLGLASVTVANNWGNLLYGDYKWHFRAVGVVLAAAVLVIHFRRQGVCTLDQAKRQRNRIVNVLLLAVIAFNAVYVLWTYVVLHYAGIAAGLPWAQWDESWAIPWSVGLIVLTGAAYWLLPAFRRDGGEVVGVEQAEGFENSGDGAGDGRDQTGDGRSQAHSPESDIAIRK